MHYENVELGRLFEAGPFCFDEQAMIDFAAVWDPRPVHVDPDAAASSSFGGIIACSAYIWSVYSRLAYQMTEKHRMDGLLAGLGWEHKILRAVRPGDSVMLRGCLTERRPSKKDPSRLIVTGRDCLFNQDDELVFEVFAHCLVQGKAGTPAA